MLTHGPRQVRPLLNAGVVHRKVAPMRSAGLVFSMGLLLLLVLADGRILRSAVANPLIPISFVSLTREAVRMDIAPESVVVHGEYSFTRLDPLNMCLIYFPFPLDSVADRPRLLDASVSFGIDDRHPIDVDCRQTPWFARIQAGGADSFMVSLTYSQPVDHSHATYPLTSRYPWFRPTESIRIEVDLPTTITDPRFSLPCSVRANQGGVTTFLWSSTGPLPDHDMDVNWRVRTRARKHGGK
jgi:hypothetical protein